MQKLLDLQNPFYRPLWLRVLITAACLLWAVVEASGGNYFWTVLFGALGLYCGYEFFLNFNPRDPEDTDGPKEP